LHGEGLGSTSIGLFKGVVVFFSRHYI
jgi:hypothetical protein